MLRTHSESIGLNKKLLASLSQKTYNTDKVDARKYEVTELTNANI